MAQNVKFISVRLQETYNALEPKDSLALYWIQDTQRLYKGEHLYGVGLAATAEFAGLMSPEDKAALDALIAAGNGISGLTAVDGTMKIVDTENGGKAIGVAISSEAGNVLVKKNDGLYVEGTGNIDLPSYSIERQGVAEDGYAVSYKLKKTVGEEESYVGDVINIPKDMVLQSAILETVVEAGVPYDGAVIGDLYIKMTFNDASASNIYVPMKGLVDVYTAGSGIEISNNVIGVKIAENSHGLVAVDGSMSMLLATANQDGAMSKEDKAFIDSIPTTYATITGINDIVHSYIEQHTITEKVATLEESISAMEESYTWGEM